MNSTLFIILAILLAFFIIRFVAKIAVKIFLFILMIFLIAGFMYYKSWWPFEQNITDIDTMEEKYCRQEPDPAICLCVIEKLREDIDRQYSEEEWRGIREDKLKSAYAFKKSLDAISEDAQNCLEERGSPDKYKSFLKDLFLSENSYSESSKLFE